MREVSGEDGPDGRRREERGPEGQSEDGRLVRPGVGGRGRGGTPREDPT